jgi:hypothetical protein
LPPFPRDGGKLHLLPFAVPRAVSRGAELGGGAAVLGGWRGGPCEVPVWREGARAICVALPSAAGWGASLLVRSPREGKSRGLFGNEERDFAVFLAKQGGRRSAVREGKVGRTWLPGTRISGGPQASFLGTAAALPGDHQSLARCTIGSTDRLRGAAAQGRMKKARAMRSGLSSRFNAKAVVQGWM